MKVTTAMLIVVLSTSCVATHLTNVSNSTTIATLEKDRIQILGPAEGKAGGGRLWVLFIPIGWGRDSWCESVAYKNALKSYPTSDGLIDQNKTYRRVKVPLIVLTPVVKTVEITGTAYHIRTDLELEEYLRTKEQRAKNE